MTDSVCIIVTDVPATLRRKLTTEARANSTSVTEIAAGILTRHYGLDHNGYRRGTFHPAANETRMVLRVPPAVRQALRRQAAEDGVTISGLAKVAFAEHYGVKPPNPGRKTRSR